MKFQRREQSRNYHEQDQDTRCRDQERDHDGNFDREDQL